MQPTIRLNNHRPTALARPAMCLCALMAIVVTGCTRWQSFPLLMGKEEQEQPVLPDRILAIWSDTVLHQPNQAAIRGFGGRVFFYAEGATEPIQVDGGVVVYAFDAEEYDTHQVAPEKKFIFTPENVSQQFSKCSLGPSYSFWIPWDTVGGPTRQISLITRFEGREGGVVISQPARKLLPGVANLKSSDETTAASTSSVKPVSYSESVGTDSNAVTAGETHDASSSEVTVETSTITLPPSMARRMAQRQQAHASALKQHEQADAQRESHPSPPGESTAPSTPIVPRDADQQERFDETPTMQDRQRPARLRPRPRTPIRRNPTE